MVSGEENTSRRDNQEKQPSVEATATKAPAQGDMTEVKKMLDTFLTEQKKQAKIIEANSKELKALSRRKRGRPDTTRLRALVDPQRLDFSAPRATRGNPDDLPPPPPRRETDKPPERVVDISDQEEPAPTKRARAEDVEGSRQEPRASDTQSASSSSKTEIVGDTAEYSNYSSEERYKKEQERRAFKRSYAAELAAVKAQMDRVTSDLKHTQSQIYQGTGKAPAIAQVLEKARNTPFDERVAKTKISDPGRIKLPVYEGTTDPWDHLMEFEVTLGRANFKEAEKDIVYCKLFVESLKVPALQWFYKLEKNSVHTFLQLSELFVQHYNIFMERKIYDSELWNNKQGETESLRSFMTRFKNTLSKVEGISNKSALEALRGALRCPSLFWQEMSLNTPTTIQDALHRAADFAQTEEEVQARKGRKSKQLKEYLATPPILAKPVTVKPLFLYIPVSETAVSAVLVREERGEQKSIFYVSKTLTDAETRYPQLEKLALSIVMASRKLRPYFQSHTIVILSTFPLRTVLHSPSQSGRLSKWAIELSEYDIEYKGRTCNKSQMLADFLIELPEDHSAKEVRPGIWELHVDGSSSKNGSGVGIRLASPTGEILEQSFRLGFRASNNEAEYEAIIAGMRLAQGLNIEPVHAFCNSQLVSNQFNGEYATKDDRMEAYQKIVKDLALTFKEFTLTRIPRGENVDGDALANLASASAPPKDPTLKRVIPVEVIEFPSIKQDMTLAISTRSQAAKQTEATTETRVKDVEMTEAEANTEPALSTAPTSNADAIGPEVIGADVTEAEDPEDLRQLEELPTQNLPLEPIDKDMTVPMDTDEET
ncbi:hypothetical protein AALP_AA3G280900 [Arabis alpina]|uniref:Uncharacterized protein n=1 Tax=Arabis alpina TaxID=50452 RepID=A0A087HC80_ARAAL|nr:hypothetical protein AALP_AA3G280900 [Arabis alpina]